MFKSFAAAIAFYTCLPVPAWSLDFRYVSRLAPLVGLLIGGLLVLEDWGLSTLGMPLLPRSAVIVASGLALTGGLHMDGAMDTADGLAVMNPERRLEVMADSNTGAFGAMTAVVILGLKVLALSELLGSRWPVLLMIPVWGRWGQQVAIASYPYLKPTGKGAFHKAALASSGYIVASGIGCSLLTIVCWTLAVGSPLGWDGITWATMGVRLGMALGVAIATGAWFNAKLGGHTGDTYGAVVEWTEAITLLLYTLLE